METIGPSASSLVDGTSTLRIAGGVGGDEEPFSALAAHADPSTSSCRTWRAGILCMKALEKLKVIHTEKKISAKKTHLVPRPASALQQVQHQMSKLWGGRFTGKTDPVMEQFNDSLYVDKVMWSADIEGSVQYSKALEAWTPDPTPPYPYPTPPYPYPTPPYPRPPR